MFGLGPIEPLLADETITDVLVNGPDQVYVERHGRLELTPYKFRDNTHVVNVAQRIAAGGGRAVDENSPLGPPRAPHAHPGKVPLPPPPPHPATPSICQILQPNNTRRLVAH